MTLGSCVAILPKISIMSLIQQCCWVLPKQKAWLRSPLLTLGDSRAHKLFQQPLAYSVPSCSTDGQQPGFRLDKSKGICKPTSKKIHFLSLSQLQLKAQLSYVPFRHISASVPDVAVCGRWLVRPGESIINSCWWSMWWGEERLHMPPTLGFPPAEGE